MSVGLFDKAETNHQLLLSLPFREGTGVLTRDVAKPCHEDVTLVGAPAWVSLATGLGVLDFNGITDYGECAAADTADLNFTSEDYSITAWIYRGVSAQSQIVLGRYLVDTDGWETYFYTSGIHEYLTLRHHHASLAPAPVRTACYSDDWTTGQWFHLAITRSGLYPKHFRNGNEIEVTYSVGGLQDPDTCVRDLVIGCRTTKNADWYSQYMWDPRIWLGELSAVQIKTLFHMDAHWFGLN